MPDGDAVAEALRIARQLADGPSEAIQATKRLAVLAPDLTIDEGLARERAEWERVRSSENTQRALSVLGRERLVDSRAGR